jgi:hypothetical protein
VAAGDHDAAEARYSEAAERDERAGAPAFVVRDLWRHAELRRERGDGVGARTLITRAARIAEERGREDLAARIAAAPQ